MRENTLFRATSDREHTIAYDDRMVRRETFDRTDVAFQAHDGAELLACGPGDAPADCSEPEIAIVRGGASPERFTARVRYPQRSERTPILAIAAALSALVALAAVALRLRRSRR